MIAPLCFVVVEILSFENIIQGVYQYIACEQGHFSLLHFSRLALAVSGPKKVWLLVSQFICGGVCQLCLI